MGYDFVFGVNVHYGLGVGEQVWVELHFCESAKVYQMQFTAMQGDPLILLERE